MTTVTITVSEEAGVSVTSATPGVFTTDGHSITDNDLVLLTGFDEMTELNGQIMASRDVDGTDLNLTGSGLGGALIDTSGFTAETTGGSILPCATPVLDVDRAGEDITFSITGTWVGTVQFQRELSPHSNVWVTIAQYTENVVRVWKQDRGDERYRGIMTAWTSGAPVISVSDGVMKVGNLVDDLGREVIIFNEDGITVPGTITPTGAFVGNLTGNVTGDVTGDLTGNVTGNITGIANVTAILGTDASLGIDGLAAAQGGAVAIKGGTSSTSANAGGAVSHVGGTPGATGVGGAAGISGAVGGATSGAGGAATITGGAGTAGNGPGGNAIVTPGANHGSGVAGAVFLRGEIADPTVPLVVPCAVPVSDTSTQAITVAELLNGIHLNDPQGDVTLTLPAGDDIVAGLPAAFAIGDSFDWTLISLNASAGENQTLADAAGSGTVTFVGRITTDPPIAAEGSGSATWRFRYTGSGGFTAYRMS